MTNQIDTIRDIWEMSSNTPMFNIWNSPIFIKAQEIGESIEFIYKETTKCTHMITQSRDERVFKIVYSCIEGKWNKSAPIYGEIISPSGEIYLFKDK